ncbi:glutamate-1-semialdehyde 2,1-aminomutase [Chloroflexota bacterium]
MNLKKSEALFSRAQRVLPGGVDSPVRAYKAVGGSPPFIARGSGSKIYDVDGSEYIDYVCSWGPLILGHNPPVIFQALTKAAANGTSFGAPTELEVILAEMVSTAMPSMEMVRFVNSGTEATMSALRLARAFTGRDRIIKFDGCYHGHSDGLLVKAGSGLATLGIPSSPGVPSGYTDNTLTAPYNDTEAVDALFKQYPGEIAAVIVEPVAANMGVVPPKSGFLENLRRITEAQEALLVFDEVITGFRLAYGGAQSVFHIMPDLTCLGKIIGGGLPVGAYGGRREIMQMVAPLGPVYQAGTLSGNPLAMSAGIAILKALQKPGIYTQLDKMAKTLEKGVKAAAVKAGINLTLSRVGSLMTPFFVQGEITDYESAAKSDTAMFARVFSELLEKGIYWAPSQFEAGFISAAHNERDIEFTITAFEQALASI